MYGKKCKLIPFCTPTYSHMCYERCALWSLESWFRRVGRLPLDGFMIYYNKGFPVHIHRFQLLHKRNPWPRIPSLRWRKINHTAINNQLTHPNTLLHPWLPENGISWFPRPRDKRHFLWIRHDNQAKSEGDSIFLREVKEWWASPTLMMIMMHLSDMCKPHSLDCLSSRVAPIWMNSFWGKKKTL